MTKMLQLTHFDRAERTARLDHYSDWFNNLRSALGLGDWTVNMQYAPPESEDASAESWRRPGCKEGFVTFSDEWLEGDREKQREEAIHELLHFVMRPLYETIDTVQSQLSTPVWVLHSRQIEIAEEWVVDSLARAIAWKYPLPPAWPPTEADPEEGVVVLPARTRFSDGETVARTILLEPEAITALAEAITARQAAAAQTGDTPKAYTMGLDPEKWEVVAERFQAVTEATEEALEAVAEAVVFSEEAEEYRPEPVEVPAVDPAAKPPKRGNAPRSMA